MFFFLSQPTLVYNFILIVAAVIPAVILMVKVARADRLERESSKLLATLVLMGLLATLLALFEEWVLSLLLNVTVAQSSPAYNVILYFIIVAGAEESSKYLFMRLRTWNNPAFNCQFDAVVYSVFVSLGFALFENISYGFSYGFSTLLVRAVTAIPGHACFGVFMGIGYGVAKAYDFQGDRKRSVIFRALCIFVPMLMHGTYDYLATMQNQSYSWIFVGFIVVMFVLSFIMVHYMSKRDRFIDNSDK